MQPFIEPRQCNHRRCWDFFNLSAREKKKRYSKKFCKWLKDRRCQNPQCWNIVDFQGTPYLPHFGQYCNHHLPQCMSLGCPNEPEPSLHGEPSVFCTEHRERSSKWECDYCYSPHHEGDECLRALQKHTGLSLKEISKESGIPLKLLPQWEIDFPLGLYDSILFGDLKNYHRVYLVYVWKKMGLDDLIDFYKLYRAWP